jgi:predicted ATP-grasp superfamily ATP-dependent carboligase
VVVISGGDIQGLDLLRTLARRQIPIILLDSDHCVGKHSSLSRKFRRSPHPAYVEVVSIPKLSSLAEKLPRVIGFYGIASDVVHPRL